MTQEEKQLLLKDLSARLPYEVFVEIEDEPNTSVIFEWKHLNFLLNWEWIIKPYLRPMSSMTEEEKLMYEGLMIGTNNIPYMLDVIDWLNAHHFDYRGLIQKGLALEAPNGMYEN